MEVVKGPDSIREEKLSQMVMQYEESLIRMCAVYLQDIQLAEDAVQDTFVKAYKHLHSFRGDSSEKTWLMKIAINTCRDIRRQSWHRYVDRRVNLDFLPV
ncbi:MAG: sigma-70 family RNA polymerase sigma factor [Clostridia bacterium]|nr:sigma-70 family RNA polymerase sigma factor [Clostridia bacterium]